MKLAETGTIRDIKKIVARVEGLPSCLFGQLVDMGDGVRGIVMGFDEDDVLILVLGDENKLKMGKEVSGVSEPFTIPVGDQFLGRIVDALGRSCDSGAPLVADENRPVFRDSPGIIDRTPVDTILLCGTKVIDSFIPIGKGQRQLIIGDRMTGKTVISLDAIISQKEQDVLCIYCCIGKSMSGLEKAISTLKDAGSLPYTVIMIALDNSPVGEQYIVPYAAASMADHFVEQGRDVLVVIDDMTKHAWAYRQLSLLLERPPGREAYPGDIFYIHTQLMERAGRLNEKHGDGSMTFLAIAETLEGDLTGYIPSNLISMCDGLVFLSNTLFGEGLRPAVDPSLSVSIVGGKAQAPIIKAMCTELKVQYAQYNEVAKLSKLQSTVSEAAANVMKRGEAIIAIMQQDQYKPVSWAEEIIVIYAVSRGRLDDLDKNARDDFVSNIYGYAVAEHAGVVETIGDSQEMTPEIERALDELLDGYFAQTGVVPADAVAEPGVEEEEMGEEASDVEEEAGDVEEEAGDS
jgi:F-type H+-transporting ATPase subunit alpha